ncbi:MAG: dienelactone hydrolase [Firmicutes bacterium]|nr:dienelactone hydrolase [Bacillota bacterium]
MLIHKNNSDTVVIVLHEIYGLNEHIRNVCKKLSKYKYDVIAPDLLNNRMHFSYEQEEFAYNYFMNKIGFESALKQIKQILTSLRSVYKKIYILGYSVGATLAWLCSQTGLCDLVIGYYGSRIRDYLNVKPECPTLLLFPSEEKSFDVEELIISLRIVNNVSVNKLYGNHGFADQFSKNYNRKSALLASKKILLFIKSIM